MHQAINGKIQEVQQILDNYKITSIKELSIDINVKEDQDTFEENAIIKAEAISKLLENKICLTDDSGIEIESLGGFPGVKTKRWLKGTDRQRNLAIIEKMKEFTEKSERKVRFKVAIAVSNGIKTICKSAYIDGYIAKYPRGENGFGFDEIFELKDGRTLAELSAEEKNKISARKKAIELIKIEIEDNF